MCDNQFLNIQVWKFIYVSLTPITTFAVRPWLIFLENQLYIELTDGENGLTFLVSRNAHQYNRCVFSQRLVTVSVYDFIKSC